MIREKTNKETEFATVKQILTIIGVTGFVGLAILMPGLPKVLSPFLNGQHKKWRHFNKRRLKYQLKRLQSKGVIEESEKDGQLIFKLTDKGKVKLLKYKIEEMTLDHKKWDGNWRLVAYVIPKFKKSQTEAFRSLLKKMGFYNLQKSLWLTPYPCKDEIEFLKSLYGLKEEVSILTIKGLEGEIEYKRYFGL